MRPRPLPGARHLTMHAAAYRLATFLGLLLAAVLLLLVLGYLLARNEPGDGWAPGPEETSTRFLDREVDSALASLDRAHAALHEDPVAAGRSLDETRRSLLRLSYFYLPLLHARERAQHSLRWYRLGEHQKAIEELEAVEDILLAISDRGHPQLSRQVDLPLKTTVDASAAVRASRTDAGALLEQLASQLNLLLLKGDLALHGTQLE